MYKNHSKLKVAEYKLNNLEEFEHLLNKRMDIIDVVKLTEHADGYTVILILNAHGYYDFTK